MIIERVEVGHVRNVTTARLDLCPGLNLLIGPNGAGKTAVLEAVHLLVRGRSFRTRRISSVIQRDAGALSVHLRCSDPARGQVRLGVTKDRSNQTELRVDGAPVHQASVVAGLLPVQLMLPDLDDLVFGGPRERRQWLDWGTFHVKQDYLDTLRDYARAVRQRNSVLRSDDHKTLEVWTSRMIELGEVVTARRRDYIDGVRPTVFACFDQLAPGLDLVLDYYPGWNGNSLAEEVGASVARDVKLGATQVGPHRADIRLRSNDVAAASVLSRGQGKVAASALRIGQAQGLLTQQARPSLFLIDDVWAELDDAYCARFFRLLGEMGCQILATSTHEPTVLSALQEDAFQGERVKTFHVEQGEIASA